MKTFLIISFLLCASSTVLFWENFKNSIYTINSSSVVKSDQNTILLDSNSNQISPPNGEMNFDITAWGERYIYKYGVPQCPEISPGRCGVYVPYECSCGGCDGCDVCCCRLQVCACATFYAARYYLIYINKIITTTSNLSQFRISFEAKGSGILNIISLFQASSCPGQQMIMRNLASGRFASDFTPFDSMTLNGTYQLFSTIYIHNTYNCSTLSDKEIIIGFNGKATIRNLVVTDPQSIEESLEGNASISMFYNAMSVDPEMIIRTVSFESSNPFDLSKLNNTYEGIDTIIGSNQGSCNLTTFSEIKNIVAKGQDNILSCGVNDSHLFGGNNKTTYKMANLEGICNIENFSITQNDTIDLTSFPYYHNFSQISNLIQQCGDDCTKIVINQTSIVIKQISINLVENINFLFEPYPCFELCPDCRYISQCEDCENCVPGQCDQAGCYSCDAPYFLHLKKCTAECVQGNYIDYENRTCTECSIDFCLYCDKDFQCFKCENQTYLYEYHCLEECPSRTYPSLSEENKICIDCEENCAECDAQGCLTCDLGYMRYQYNSKYKCLIQDCPLLDHVYDETGACQPIVNVDFTEDAYQVSQYDSLNYLLSEYDENTHFIGENDLNLYNISSCNCYEQKKNIGFLPLLATLKKFHQSSDAFKLCNLESSIFDNSCLLSTEKFDEIFLNQTSYEEEINVFNLDFQYLTYNSERFWNVFNKIRGSGGYYVILNIINGTDFKQFLLLEWTLRIKNDSLLSFHEYDIFVVSDPQKGKGKFFLNFTYGKQDKFLLTSFMIFKKIQNNKVSPPILNSQECKEFILNYEKCRIIADSSLFKSLYEKHIYRMYSFSKTAMNMSLDKQCALVDLTFYLGDAILLNFNDFKSYIDNADFSEIFSSDDEYYQLHWKNDSRIQKDLKILAGLEQLKNDLIQEKCIYSIQNIINERSCNVSVINNFREQILQELMTQPNENNSFVKLDEINSNFSNLLWEKENYTIILEKQTYENFTKIVKENPGKQFKLLNGIYTLPEVYLLLQWNGICSDNWRAEKKEEVWNLLTGLTIYLENYVDLHDIMINNGYTMNSDNSFSLNLETVDLENLKEQSIKTFQRLWNCNNQNDLLIENGVISNDMIEKLKLMDKEGFSKLC